MPLTVYSDYKVRQEIMEKSPDPQDMVNKHKAETLTRNQAMETGMDILPFTLEDLIDKRDKIKKEMKYVKKDMNRDGVKQDQKRQFGDKIEALDIKQLAVKVVANSIYGSLGYKTSRFYSKDIAAMVTFYGRSLLMKTIDVIKQEGYQVLYGDTD